MTLEKRRSLTQAEATPAVSAELTDTRAEYELPVTQAGAQPALHEPDSSSSTSLWESPLPEAALHDEGRESSSHHMSEPATLMPTEKDELAFRLQRGEDLIHEGNYIAARQVFREFGDGLTGGMRAQLLLRLALCQEALGDHADALANYRRVIGINVNPPINEAALLGQSRVWKNSGQTDLATSTLFRALLEFPRDGTDTRQSSLPHQLGALLASRFRSASETAVNRPVSLLDDVLTVPSQLFRPEKLLEEWSKLDFEAGRRGPSSSAPGITVTDRFGSAPDEVLLSLRSDNLTALDLIEGAVTAAGWSVETSPAARRRLQEHTLRPDCTDLPVAIILDALMDQYQLCWTWTPSPRSGSPAASIVVRTHDETDAAELTAARRAAARRTLTFACGFAPDHWGAATSYMELGRLNALETASADAGVAPGRVSREQAIRGYRQAIELFPRSEHVPDAWLNIGKLHLQGGELQEAVQALHRAVDSMTGHPLQPVAYIYLGRIHLELDAPRSAVSPLIRGLALAATTEFEPVAALLLASAYYLLENPRGANTVLVDHRQSFKESAVRDQAAFLAALIRFRAASSPRHRDTEGTILIQALTNLDQSQFFGGHWPYLVGTAYRETGMTEQSLATFAASFRSSYSFPLQDRMRSVLLREGVPTPSQLPSNSGVASESRTIHFEVDLAEAQQAFRSGDHDETLRLCRRFLTQPDAPVELRREALRMMGRVFQIRGDHRQAVLCFTGVVPEENPSVDESRSVSEPGVVR